MSVHPVEAGAGKSEDVKRLVGDALGPAPLPRRLQRDRSDSLAGSGSRAWPVLICIYL